jgi:hypothetical protein
VGFSNHEVEITEIDLLPGDGLVLCSDGVYTTLDVQEMAKCLARASSAESAARVIVKRALRNGSDDNTTAVVAFDVAPGAQVTRPRVRQNARSITQTLRMPVADANRAADGYIDGSQAPSMPEPSAMPMDARGVVTHDTLIRPHRSIPDGNASVGDDLGLMGDYGRRRRPVSFARIIVGAILVLLLIVGAVLFATHFMGSSSGAGAPHTEASKAPAVEDNDAKAPKETSKEGEKQPDDANLPQTHDKHDSVADMRSYTIGEGAVLRYVDAKGVAHRFSDGLTPGIDISIGEETSITAHTQTDTFGRDSYSYRQLSDDYVQDLLRDCDRCRQGATTYTSALSNMVKSDEYASLIQALSKKSSSELKDTLAHLAVSDEDLTQSDEESSDDAESGDNTQYEDQSNYL